MGKSWKAVAKKKKNGWKDYRWFALQMPLIVCFDNY